MKSKILFAFVLFYACYDNSSYYTFIQRYTGLKFPSKGIEVVSINDNSENYLTAVMKIESSKLTKFEQENLTYKFDCSEIDIYLEMFDKIIHKRVKKANSVCFKSNNEKFWQMKIDSSGNIYLEIWY